MSAFVLCVDANLFSMISTISVSVLLCLLARGSCEDNKQQTVSISYKTQMQLKSAAKVFPR